MKRGGKREGAGRKPHKIKGLLKELPPDTAALILADMDAENKWRQLADSKDERIVLDTLRYLTDRAYGRAKQSMELDDKRRADGASRLAELLEGAIKTGPWESWTGRTQ